jgi:NitT/TauT family transport system permease protein
VPGRAALDAELVQETPGAEPPGPRRRRQRGVALPVVSLLLFAGLLYAVWEVISLARVVPAFILPTPLQVAQDFGLELSRGDLLANAGVTLQEALGGFALAIALAGVLGYAIAYLRPLEVLVAPFLAASQAIPVVAVAPIIILLLGAGLRPKVLICAVVVVFPLLITVVTGLRSVGRDYHDVARVFGASRLQTLVLVELPLAAPTLLSGIKLGLTLSIMGAVVGEFVAADSGLGFMINSAVGNFQASPRYVALIALAILSITLFGLVTLLERILLRWQDA